MIHDQQPMPIVLLTAYSQEKLIQAAEVVGVMTYLVKPVNERSD